MPKIDQTKLGATWIPLPPARDEQERIVAEVDRRLSLLEAAERTMETNLARAHMLRRAIVRDAFSGRLVPQDPTDEPAKGLPTGDSHIQPDARASRRLIASMAKETS